MILRQYSVSHYTGKESERPDSLPEGDFYFSTDTGSFFKYGSKGTVPTAVRGGAQGAQGPSGPAGAPGQSGASFEVDATGEITETIMLAIEVGLLYSTNSPYIHVVTIDNRIDKTNRINFADLSLHAILYNGTVWTDMGPFTGVAGQTGNTGADGDTGIQGPIGQQGIQGESGGQGIQGEDGDQGTQGPTGPQGVQGGQGTQGVQGEAGGQGVQGPDGQQGIQGDQGTQGIQGESGGQGIQGEAGQNGATSDLELIDEDDMSSNDETKPPSQQSVKAFVDNTVSALRYSRGDGVAGIFDTSDSDNLVSAKQVSEELIARISANSSFTSTVNTATSQQIEERINLKTDDYQLQYIGTQKLHSGAASGFQYENTGRGAEASIGYGNDYNFPGLSRAGNGSIRIWTDVTPGGVYGHYIEYEHQTASSVRVSASGWSLYTDSNNSNTGGRINISELRTGVTEEMFIESDYREGLRVHYEFNITMNTISTSALSMNRFEVVIVSSSIGEGTQTGTYGDALHVYMRRL